MAKIRRGGYKSAPIRRGGRVLLIMTVLLGAVVMLHLYNPNNPWGLEEETNKHCSSESLRQHPARFGECMQDAPPNDSCQPQQLQNWNKWVESRYAELSQCVTPDYIQSIGKQFAVSGRGSTLKATKALRDFLEQKIFSTSSNYNIQTFLDCPCGDFLWMQLVNMPQSVQYFGADITPTTEQKNTECFESNHRHFYTLDWSCKVPPPVDLILVRDVLFHLPTSVNLDILRHINQSGAKYLLTTTFGDYDNRRPNFKDEYNPTGIGYRSINLYEGPYNFPKPLTQVWEPMHNRWVGLYRLPLTNLEES